MKLGSCSRNNFWNEEAEQRKMLKTRKSNKNWTEMGVFVEECWEIRECFLRIFFVFRRWNTTILPLSTPAFNRNNNNNNIIGNNNNTNINNNNLPNDTSIRSIDGRKIAGWQQRKRIISNSGDVKTSIRRPLVGLFVSRRLLKWLNIFEFFLKRCWRVKIKYSWNTRWLFLTFSFRCHIIHPSIFSLLLY